MGKMNVLKWTEDGTVTKLNLITEMAPQWENIGSQIGLTPAQLQSWRMQHSSDPAACMTSVIQAWMQRRNEDVGTVSE